jgi:hypothetical protein
MFHNLKVVTVSSDVSLESLFNIAEHGLVEKIQGKIRQFVWTRRKDLNLIENRGWTFLGLYSEEATTIIKSNHSLNDQNSISEYISHISHTRYFILCVFQVEVPHGWIPTQLMNGTHILLPKAFTTRLKSCLERTGKRYSGPKSHYITEYFKKHVISKNSESE